MITKLIAIGNSRGIRIPKLILNESGLNNQVELKVKKGEIRIINPKIKSKLLSAPLLMSEKTLATDWNRSEEESAWASLQ